MRNGSGNVRGGAGPPSGIKKRSRKLPSRVCLYFTINSKKIIVYKVKVIYLSHQCRDAVIFFRRKESGGKMTGETGKTAGHFSALREKRPEFFRREKKNERKFSGGEIGEGEIFPPRRGRGEIFCISFPAYDKM